MAKRFVMTRGLPGSGKSTWAEQQILAAEPGKAVRVNRDLIRTMLHADRFAGRKTEAVTEALRDMAIQLGFSRGCQLVISDDTNLDPNVQERLRSLATAHGYAFEVKDFTDVPIKTCIERDLKRQRSVGEKVIKDMFRRYLEPPYEPVVVEEGLPWAILVDIDGTLAHMVAPEGGKVRSPYDYGRVMEDALDEVVAELVRDAVLRGDVIIVMSGRDEACRDETEKWLVRQDVDYDWLFMRSAGDMRKDSIVKSELFDAHVARRFNVRYVLDDRNQVVEMWRARGLKVLQVAEGNF